MSTYFFHFRQGASYSLDAHGCEFENVEEAYLAAVRAAQDMWRELLILREDPLACSFDVSDAGGNELFSLPFAEVLDVCQGRKQGAPAPLSDGAELSGEDRDAAIRVMNGMSSAVRQVNSSLQESIRLVAKMGNKGQF